MAPKKLDVKKPPPPSTSTSHSATGSSSSTPLRKFTSSEIDKMMVYSTVIGTGSTAIVFKGKWEKKDVAIKQYKQRMRLYWEIERRFFEEFQHPHIVKCHGYCNEDGKECFVLECMHNSLITKDDITKEDKVIELDWKSTLNVLIQVTEAVSYINSNEKIIGDLKPEGIMLDTSNNAKLVDFNSIVEDGSFPELGTNNYAAPEACTGTSVHRKSDVFSIGTIILEMLSGTRSGELPRKTKHKGKERHEKQENIKKAHITELVEDKKAFKIRDKLIDTGCTGGVATQIVEIAIASTRYEPIQRLEIGVLLERLRKLATQDQITKPTTVKTHKV